MEREVLFMTLAVVLAHGATNEIPTDLKCYKTTTHTDEDFICSWIPGASAENSTYTLHYCSDIKASSCKLYDAGRNHSFVLLRDYVFTDKETYLLVEAHLGSNSFKSSNLSVVLKDQVQYDAPHIENMSRSSGSISLHWKRPPSEAIINEIQFRRRGDRLWKNKTLETNGKNDQENLTVTILDDTVYEVRVRRRAKGLKTVIWSAWSQTKVVPVEIRKQPAVTWDVGELSRGVRLLNLRWEAPLKAESVGGVTYRLSLVFMPCADLPKTVQIKSTKYSTNMSASAASVNITAINHVGESPKQIVNVPAQHLKDCPKDRALPVNHSKANKCMEWHELTGVTSTGSVKYKWAKNATHEISEIKQGLKDFVRYHYFFHMGGNKKPRTIALCPIYKTEGVPKHGPPNVTVVDVTHNSKLVSWQPIPIRDQRGFLRNYVIYITKGYDTNVVQVNASQTKYTIHNLTPGTLYIVHVAGETAMGVGPNTTGQILLSLPPGVSHLDWIIIGPIVLTLVLTILCNFIKRLKCKLLPEIPTPVITETPVSHSRDKEELYPVGEEVHTVVLLHDHPDKSNKPPPFLEESSLLEACETSLCEDEGGESQTDSDAFGSSSPLSSDYKRQRLSLQAPPEPKGRSREQADCEATTPIYRNNLVFEPSSDIRTQL